MLTLEAIQALLQRKPGTELAAKGGDDGAALDGDAERAGRTASLADVLHSAQAYWEAGSEDIDRVAEMLGNASRDGTCAHSVPRSRASRIKARLAMSRICINAVFDCSRVAHRETDWGRC